MTSHSAGGMPLVGERLVRRAARGMGVSEGSSSTARRCANFRRGHCGVDFHDRFHSGPIQRRVARARAHALVVDVHSLGAPGPGGRKQTSPRRPTNPATLRQRPNLSNPHGPLMEANIQSRYDERRRVCTGTTSPAPCQLWLPNRTRLCDARPSSGPS